MSGFMLDELLRFGMGDVEQGRLASEMFMDPMAITDALSVCCRIRILFAIEAAFEALVEQLLGPP